MSRMYDRKNVFHRFHRTRMTPAGETRSIGLKCLAARPMATLRLLCLPFAGAGAGAFRGWGERLPPHVEAYAVQLPGREDRLAQAPFVAWDAMMLALVDAVAALPPQPLAILGHSLGAQAGHALAQCMAHGGEPPVHVFVSGRHWSDGRDGTLAALWTADDDSLLAGMARRYGALPASLSHPEIRELLLPTLRADLQLLDSRQVAPAPPLPCPLTVFAGREDPSTPPEALAGWRSATSGAFDIAVFDGGHFFIESHRDAVLAELRARLPPPPRW
jgi:surfactin synthase thioesterase subunit